MSILDGIVDLDLDGNSNSRNNKKSGNNNNKNRQDNNNRRNNNRDGSRNYFNNDYSFNNSSYVMKDEQESEEVEVVENENDPRAKEIFSFVEDFLNSIKNYKNCQDIVIDDFPDVVQHMRHYYGSKNSKSLNDALNKLVNLFSTTQFANVLSAVLDSGVWTNDDTYDKCWRSIAYGLSVAIITSHNKMHSSVLTKYAHGILPRIWHPEIHEIVVNVGVTKDLVLDLIIAIPMIDSKWNTSNINAFYSQFLEKIIYHAEDNMDVLNYEVQGMLFDRVFGKNTDTALKVIGKYLTSEPLEIRESEVEEAVYKDFIKMLYTKLDGYDIKQIAYVFKYVSKYRGENPDKKTIFKSTEASKYENVRKGLLQTMDEDPNSMNTLA